MSPAGIPPHILAQLRSAFSRLERMEGNPGDYSDETWAALLEQSWAFSTPSGSRCPKPCKF